MDAPIELKDRQLIDLLDLPRPTAMGSTDYFPPISHFGVALDNEEALAFIQKGFRVYGDEEGPFLVVRIPAPDGPGKLEALFPFDKNNATVTIQPLAWNLRNEQTGIICWLKKIS